MSAVSALNSTSSPLASGGEFQGSWAPTHNFHSITLSVSTDQPGWIYVDSSVDNKNVDETIKIKVEANTPMSGRRVTATRSSFRIRYQNDGGNQTYFRLQARYGSPEPFPIPFNSVVSQDSSTLVVRALTEDQLIAEGKFEGYSSITKAGFNPDVDKSPSRLPEDIWGGDGVYAGFPDGDAERLKFSSTSDQDKPTGTGLHTVFISGLGDDWSRTTETVDLNGTGDAFSVNTYRRASFMLGVAAATPQTTNKGTVTVSHETTTANVFLKMLPGVNQTNCAGYTVAAGETAYVKRTKGSMIARNADLVRGGLWQRNFDGVFRLRRPFMIGTNSPHDETITGGVRLAEKTDIIPRIVWSKGNNIDVIFKYDMTVVKNG